MWCGGCLSLCSLGSYYYRTQLITSTCYQGAPGPVCKNLTHLLSSDDSADTERALCPHTNNRNISVIRMDVQGLLFGWRKGIPFIIVCPRNKNLMTKSYTFECGWIQRHLLQRSSSGFCWAQAWAHHQVRAVENHPLHRFRLGHPDKHLGMLELLKSKRISLSFHI